MRAFVWASVLTTAVCSAACGGDGTTESAGTTGSAGTGGAATSGSSMSASGGATTGSGGAGGCSVSSNPDCRYLPSVRVEGGLVTRQAELDAVLPGGAPFPMRKLPILIRWSTKATGKLPVVVWSHGGTWNATGETLNTKWSTVLAEAGYLVIHMAHVPLQTPGQLGTLCDAVGIDKASTECDDFTLYENYWLDKACDNDSDCLSECTWAKQGCACVASTKNPSKKTCGAPSGVDNPLASLPIIRATDTANVLNSLGMIAKQLAGDGMNPVEIDTEKVALVAWSGGTKGVMLGAGAVCELSKTLNRYKAPQAKPLAFVAISPQGPGYSNYFQTMSENSWEAINRPTMVLTGLRDEKSTNDMTGLDRRKSYDNMPPGDKYMWYSTRSDEAVDHGTFNLGDYDLTMPSKLDPLSFGLQSAALAFLDSYVRGDDIAKNYLASQDLAKADGGNCEWMQK